MSFRVLLADGRWLIRVGLRATLEMAGGHEVVGEAGDVATAVARTIELAPDIALLDVRLPGDGGIAAARLIKARQTSQKLLLLADPGDEASVRDSLRAGCEGCVRKDVSASELLEAIDSVCRGNVYLDAELTRQLVLSDHRRETQSEAGPLADLTPREMMVFRLIGAGFTNRGAGDQMTLSPKTVEKYRASLMQKLKLQSAVDLRMLALELGVARRAAAPAVAGNR
jgi:DNA-binding NarL/FixJ family response regulator